MKIKLSLLISSIVIGFIANAQNDMPNTRPMGKYSFGIYAGINFQNINGKNEVGTKLTNTLVTKFNIGLNLEIPIATEFYLQPGIQFISKGSKGQVTYTDNSGSRQISREINMNYIEIPVNFIYKPLVGNGHLILGFGPYFGYCISGKAKFPGTEVPPDTDLQFEKTAPNNDPNNFKYFKHSDIGANFLVGYEIQNGLNLILNSQLGLVNINSNTSSQLMNKNTGFGLVLGYRF